MKKLFSNVLNAAPVFFALVAVGAANLFAGMPCLGPYYDPEMPESLKK